MVSDGAVLVTGSHRSGTTWVGRMLAASRQLGYVHEPFNVHEAAPWLRRPMPHWFQYVCAENEAPYVAAMADVLRLRFPLAAQRPTSVHAAASSAKRAVQSWQDRARGARALVKDPIALFSTPWLVDRFGVEPVILVRHPAAFTSSLLRLRWRFDVANLLEQPLLMRDLLGPWAGELRAAAGGADPVEEAIVLWRVLYGVVDRFRDEHPEWCVLRHEDLAGDPDAGFAALYARLGLRYEGRARAAVLAHSGERPGPGPSEPARHDVRRDSRAARDAWFGRLTPAEIDRVRAGVGDLADRFYAEGEWTRVGGRTS